MTVRVGTLTMPTLVRRDPLKFYLTTVGGPIVFCIKVWVKILFLGQPSV